MTVKSIGPACELGEGALWHPLRGELFWFDIPACRLYAFNAEGENLRFADMGEPASCAGWVDDNTLGIATASGLRRYSITDDSWSHLMAIEADNSATRSNDGRVGPDGSFWITTMGFQAERGAGAAYRYKKGALSTLVPEMSIPNATCFSPDGRTAYLSDTARRTIWRWELDQNGDPVGQRQVHISLKEEGLNPDGAVCDSEGYLWNAQYGASRVARYAPDGSFDRAIELPASQITCPAFGGPDLKTLYLTSARQGLSPEQLIDEPLAGATFMIDMDVAGIRENRLLL